MNILVVGSGGREHAIIKKLASDNGLNYNNNKLFCVGSSKNPGILQHTQDYLVDSMDTFANVIQFINQNDIYLVVIGPEKYLEMGLSDMLGKIDIKCIGPTSSFAKIETSKGFLRNLMMKYNMKEFCPKYKIFDNDATNGDMSSSYEFLKDLGEHFVIKYDGLKGGKGVKVSGVDLHTTEEGLQYCSELDKFVIEEKLIGEEFSLMSFSDGVNLVHMPPVQDYKRLQCGNVGKQTGGMGCISYPTFLTDNDINNAENLNYDIIGGISRENGFNGYKGIIYGSFIKTDYGIKVIEYNSRFGDPECLLVLELLQMDLGRIFNSIIDGTLNELNVTFSKDKLLCKYLVPLGYPDSNSVIQNQIINWERINKDNIILGSVSISDDNIVKSLSSRTLGVIGKDYNEINSILDSVSGDFYYRKDIGDNSTKVLYEDAGVNIDEGNLVVEKIKQHVKNTHTNNVVSAYGSFGGLYRFGNDVLVASTDGVGTKTKFVLQNYPTKIGLEMLGYDIVNHCVNDILVEGAVPEFFMDYFASSKIDSDNVESFVKGVSNACKGNHCVLLGGETAEMPGVYIKDSVEIVGTIVGSKRFNFSGVREGDIVLAFPSVSLHTNGYSLVRKILDGRDIPQNLLDNLCAPHKSYLGEIVNLVENGIAINGLCHITGGGLIENPKRVLPQNCEIKYKGWNIPDIFTYLEHEGNLCKMDMMKTFNMGIGMMVFVNRSEMDKLSNKMNELFEIGVVMKL